MTFGAVDIPTRGVDDLRKALRDHEAKLANAKKQRDRILIDMRKAVAAADTGDKRARSAHGGLNKEDAAAGRLILSLEAQVAEARKRLEMALNQVAVADAKAHAMAPMRDGEPARWFEVRTPDDRVIRHRAASLEALQGALLKGYTVTAEIFGASAGGIGGVAAQIGADVPSIMAGLLTAFGGELETWLAARGVKAT
jgi:hypothetical protein